MSAEDRENSENPENRAADVDPVVRNVERSILLGALKQVESVNVDDDNWRIDPAPAGDLEGVLEEVEEGLPVPE